MLLPALLILPEVWGASLSNPAANGADSRYRFRHITDQNGLKYTWIWNISQDSRGYLWFSTMYGTYRYDGYEFEEYVFTNRHNGTAVNVMFVTEDSAGFLWFGTDDGLYRHDRRYNSYIHYASNEESPLRLSSDDIRSMAEAHDGSLWIGSTNGLNVIDPSLSSCRIVSPPDPAFPVITAVTCLTDGRLLFGDNGGGLWFADNDGNCEKIPLEGVRHAVMDIFGDSRGRIWVASEGSGLYRIDPDGATVRYTRYGGNLSNDIVREVREDLDGNIWAATEEGITIFSDDTAEFLYRRGNDKWGLNDNAIYSLFCDRDGAMWVGTFFGGINVMNTRFGMFSDLLSASGENVLKGSAVSSITSVNEHIFIGTENHGVFVYDTDKAHFSNYRHGNSGLGNDNVHAVCVDDRNNLWVGNYYGGLSRMRSDGTFTVYRNDPGDPSSIPSNSIYSIMQDRAGNLWIGTRYGGGLCRYDYVSGRFERLEGLPSWLFVWDMIEDYRGDIWLACYGDGIYKLDRIRNYEPVHILTEARNYINLCELSDGRILAGAEKEGITAINIGDLSVRQYTTADGLPDDTVYGILQDGFGNIWFSTNSGICKSGPGLDRFSRFTVADGLPTNRFNYNACARIGNRLWFGSIDGIVGIDPAAEMIAAPAHRIRFNNLYIHNEKQPVGKEDGNLLPEELGSIGELVLRNDRLSWGVDFSCNVFDNNAVHYAYRLEGMDDQWHNIGTRNRTDFTGLGFGHYKLTVSTLDEQGRPSDNRCSLTIFIKPPWWRSTMALICYTLAILSVAAYLVRLLINNTRTRHAFELERLAREKDKEINEMKLRFFVNISHEFKTPLSLIIGPINSFLEGNVPKGADEKYFNVIKKNAEKLLDLINELLAFRELEHLELHIHPLYYRPFVESLLARYNWLFESKNIRVSLKETEPELLIWADIDKLEKVVSNLLSNAYKFTPVGGDVVLEIEQTQDGILTTIANSGPGIDPEKLPHIFDRFFTGRTYDRYSSGVGLSYVKSLVELHGGEITVESRDGEHTSFAFLIPSHSEAGEKRPADIVRYDPEIFDELRLQPDVQGRLDDPTYLELERQTLVLVVEDDTTMRNMLAESLAANFRVESAAGAAQALGIIERQKVDVLVTDVMLGEGMNGFELCKTLKNDIETSHIRIVLTTVLSENSYKEYGYNVGADAIVAKPFEFSLLTMCIRNLIYNTWKARKTYMLDIDLSNIDITHSDSDEQLIKRAVGIIFDNLSEPEFSVEDLCGGLTVSQSTLYRKLKVMTGQSINEFIQNIRLKYAARLLLETSRTVSEIAFDVGFTDSSYFSRAFRKCFGVPPKQWREQGLPENGDQPL